MSYLKPLSSRVVRRRNETTVAAPKPRPSRPSRTSSPRNTTFGEVFGHGPSESPEIDWETVGLKMVAEQEAAEREAARRPPKTRAAEQEAIWPKESKEERARRQRLERAEIELAALDAEADRFYQP